MNTPFFLDYSLQDWKTWLQAHHYKPFQARQILDWIYKGKQDPKNFSNLPPLLREHLAAAFNWDLPTIDTKLDSQDKSSKFLLKLTDGQLIESVLMPTEGRVTLCISSQVGCRMGCTFCQTGKLGLGRNLSSGEILAQIFLTQPYSLQKITNIVFMGMGEPLDNFDEVIKATRAMLDPTLLGLSKHKVTISTSGLIPEIERLGKELPVSLAISFHTPFDHERSEIMPVNRKYPLPELKKALLEYPISTRHGITFEYVMIEGKNDSLAHAKALVSFLHGLKAKVNLIPMNPHPGNSMKASSLSQLQVFQAYLEERSISAPIRFSRGQDVSAACGQLASKRQAELHLDPRLIARERRSQKRT